MYKYGVKFGDIHSYKDWGLLTKSRPVISAPEPRTIYIDIPASDGQLDLTESLTGDVKYKSRQIKTEFVVTEARAKWNYIFSTVMNYLHGKKLKITFDEDLNHYYLGRVKVDELKSNIATSTIVISAEVDPYKYDVENSIDPWQWDSFNFEEGVIREYANIDVNGELIFTIIGSRKKVIPTFIVNSSDGNGMNVTYDGKSYHLNDGVNMMSDIIIFDGSNTIIFNGNGTVSIEYRGGSL